MNNIERRKRVPRPNEGRSATGWLTTPTLTTRAKTFEAVSQACACLICLFLTQANDIDDLFTEMCRLNTGCAP